MPNQAARDLDLGGAVVDVDLPSAQGVGTSVTLQAGRRTLDGPRIALVGLGNSVGVNKLLSTHE